LGASFMLAGGAEPPRDPPRGLPGGGGLACGFGGWGSPAASGCLWFWGCGFGWGGGASGWRHLGWGVGSEGGVGGGLRCEGELHGGRRRAAGGDSGPGLPVRLDRGWMAWPARIPAEQAGMPLCWRLGPPWRHSGRIQPLSVSAAARSRVMPRKNHALLARNVAIPRHPWRRTGQTRSYRTAVWRPSAARRPSLSTHYRGGVRPRGGWVGQLWRVWRMAVASAATTHRW